MSKNNHMTIEDGHQQVFLVRILVVFAIIIFSFSGWAWWHSIRSNPQRTLYRAIENNLRVRSVTRGVAQESGAQKRNQNVELSLGTAPMAHGFTVMSQSVGSVSTTINTEAISTPTEEFVRYTAIETDQKTSKGKRLNFDNLINIWGRTAAEQTGEPGALYGESILGIVPTANLNAHDRQILMKIVRDNNVYDFDGKTLERKIQNGRPTYIYDLSVEPVAYIKLLKQFGSMMNLEQLEGLDPSQYEGAQPLTFKLTIDVWSQRLTGVTYDGGMQSEQLSSYGIHHDVDLPKESIPVEELQAKLQAVQE